MRTPKPALALALVLLVCGIIPHASAAPVEVKGGYRSCAGVGGGVVVTYGKTKGYVSHTQNSEDKDFGYSSGWKTTQWRKGYRTAFWEVSASIELDGGYTRAACPE